MRIKQLHRWDLSPREAVALQRELAAKVKARGRPGRVRTIAGADIATGRPGGEAAAAVIVFTYPGLEEIGRATARGRLSYPYIPGLLSFREAPLLLAAFAKLKAAPDVAMFDGQGIAHPRGLGLASHMGLWLGIPTIGCAKSRLVGRHDEPGIEPGSFTDLTFRPPGKGAGVIGACLRTRRAVRPVFVSPGHLIGLGSAIEITMGCCDGLRIPKPTRLADKLVGKLAR